MMSSEKKIGRPTSWHAGMKHSLRSPVLDRRRTSRSYGARFVGEHVSPCSTSNSESICAIPESDRFWNTPVSHQHEARQHRIGT